MRRFPDIRYFSDYYHYIVGLIDKSDIVINRITLTKSYRWSTASITTGEIRAPEIGGYPDETAQSFDERNGLIFRDGSFLRFSETVSVNRRDGVTMLDYSYHYQRLNENFFIRFDFEELPSPDPIWKPQCHVHTNAKPELHIPCILFDLNMVLEFIKVNFFIS
ncbi:hypothetical protein FJZ31_01545 [Candidatus Poribacteria bacterium]|nr:hypothetical protein [Candidatus Poribacteria bacterium]